ncbi:MAG: apolipoprotein N-acyltransferase [Pseudomonadota bacterium]
MSQQSTPPTPTLPRLERAHHWLIAHRAVRFSLAALSGAILGLAFPPYNFLPAIGAYAVLLILLDMADTAAHRPWLERLIIGALFGFGFHLMGLWWIGAAFLVEADRYAILLPVAVLGLPLILAPFTALATLTIGLAPSSLAWRALALALGISLTEWLRSFVLTGFPWNAAGVGLTQSNLMAQSAAAVGVNGMALAVVLFGTLPATLAQRRSRWIAVPAGLVLAAMTAFGVQRLLTAPPTAGDALTVRVVQPAVPQDQKWDPANRGDIWSRLLALSASESDGPDVVVWPETAVPFLYRPTGDVKAALSGALGDDTLLITGAVEIEDTPQGRRTTNTVYALTPDGAIGGRYDKARLVPFGEFVPLSGILARLGFEALAAGDASFSAGPGPQTLAVGRLPPFQPLICYEVIFSDAKAEPAEWIVNVTNDAWFGNTPGPRQHLRHARLRAIERGLPVVRAANTGISAIIDSTGRVSARLALNDTGAITEPLPPTRAAPYARWGDLPLYALWLVLAAVLVSARARAKRQSVN